MLMDLSLHGCGNCPNEATHAIRLNGPRSLSVWMLPLMPTGVRIDAWLCRDDLLAITKGITSGDIRFGFVGTSAEPEEEPTHRSTVQKALAKKRKEAK